MKKILLPTLMLIAISLPAMASNFFNTSIPMPAGLGIGDEFQLVFVTTSSSTATNTDINFYNSFVNTDANATPGSLLAGLGIEWSVLGSTAAVNVLSNIVNTPSTVGIYDLAGDLIANGTGTSGTGLYSGVEGSSGIQNPLDVTDTGAVVSENTWTGTDVNGATSTGCGNGPSPLGGSESEAGFTGSNLFWTQACSIANPTFSLPLYAISNLLIVGPADEIEVVPEPSMSGPVLTALFACWLAFRRRS